MDYLEPNVATKTLALALNKCCLLLQNLEGLLEAIDLGLTACFAVFV